MEIPDAVLEAGWKASYAAPVQEAPKAFMQVIAKWAREQALQEVSDEIAKIAPYNCELKPDGNPDRVTEAWVEGIHDAWEAVEAMKEPKTTPLEDLADAVWQSEFEIEQGHVHERREP